MVPGVMEPGVISPRLAGVEGGGKKVFSEIEDFLFLRKARECGN